VIKDGQWTTLVQTFSALWSSFGWSRCFDPASERQQPGTREIVTTTTLMAMTTATATATEHIVRYTCHTHA
jgi:hypothetical protein